MRSAAIAMAMIEQSTMGTISHPPALTSSSNVRLLRVCNRAVLNAKGELEGTLQPIRHAEFGLPNFWTSPDLDLLRSCPLLQVRSRHRWGWRAPVPVPAGRHAMAVHDKRIAAWRDPQFDRPAGGSIDDRHVPRAISSHDRTCRQAEAIAIPHTQKGEPRVYRIE